MSLFGSKIYDQRAMAGALALLFVGANLTIMMAFYFFPSGEAFSLLQSRWWWELTFSMEILCLALMWMCHQERITEAEGWKKARAISRLLVGLAGVSTPSWVLVICAANDWFQNPPDLMDLAYYAGVVFIVWVVTAYVIPIAIALATQKPGFIYLGVKGQSRGGAMLLASPFLLLLLVAAIEIPRGSHLHIVVWPFLTYLHGAMPYLVKAFRPAAPSAGLSLMG